MTLLLLSASVNANEFTDFEGQQQQAFADFKINQQQALAKYRQQLMAGFADFKQTYAAESKQYRQQMTLRWGNYKANNRKVWVNYAKEGDRRESINFKTGVVEVEFLVAKEVRLQSVRERAQKSLPTLLTITPKQAFENDVVSQKVERWLKQHHKAVVKTAKLSARTKIMTPLIKNIESATVTQVNQLADDLMTSAHIKSRHLGVKKVVTLTYKIPTNLVAKSAQYARRITEIADKENIPVPLVYAVMEAESNFNTYAKSATPAYGLMQIVPTSAGKDASLYLFGKSKILAPSYLYNSDNNIAIGGAYLHILYHRYLQHIKDDTSRLYCIIAAYNIGVDNVAKSFVKSSNINQAVSKINTLSADEVYQHLQQNLPYNETKRYVENVVNLMAKYSL